MGIHECSGDCIPISETATYAAPSCSDATIVNENFNFLR